MYQTHRSETDKYFVYSLISVNYFKGIKMAKNTGENRRNGSVKGRTQTYNPVTDQHVKRDATTGQFIGAKKGKYKGIREEK